MVVLFTVSISAETVYKKTNPDGSVVFTDQPSTDTEEVQIRKPTTYTPTRLPSLSLPTKKLQPNYNYSLTINKPANDSTIVGVSDVIVSVSVQPSISRTGHQLRYQLAGKSIISRNATETFTNVDRGTHNLTVSVVNKNGEVVSPVVSTTFHMKRFFKKPKAP